MKRTLLLFALTLAGCGAGPTVDCSTLTDKYTNYGQTFVDSKCRSCHQHTSQYGTQAAVQASLSRIESEISAGRMPEGTPLSTAEKNRVLAWLSCGAP
ncbi:MAG: hypothetical protein ACOZQL_14165 [Myxococcota bacterium]